MLPVKVSHDALSARHLKHGHVTVGVAARRLLAVDLRFKAGVLLRAPGPDDDTPNTAPIWVGSAKITADSNERTGGLPILPGATVFLPIEDPTDIWVVSTVASQDLAWLGA